MICEIQGKDCHSHATEKYCGKIVCQACKKIKQEQKHEQNQEYREDLKIEGIRAGTEWFTENWDNIKQLPFKNKKKTLKKIHDFFSVPENLINEPIFNILIHDIVALQGGDPASQFPYPKDFRLNGKRADVYDRKNNMAIECKAAWFGTTAQRELPKQLKEYRHNFGPKAVIFAVSPDHVQPKTTDFLTACQLIIKVCKK